MRQKIVCILAAQRAGTTALQTAMSSTGDLVNYGEIFQMLPSGGGPKRRLFWSFVRDQNVAFTDVISVRGAARVAAEYLEWLRQGAAPAHVLIDVKFNALSALSPLPRFLGEEPFFLRVMKRENVIILFIWRKDLGEQVLSTYISRKLGLWHNITPQKMGNLKFSAPVERLSRLATLICTTENAIGRYLSGYQNCLILSYEELFADGVIAGDALYRIRSITGIDIGSGMLGRMRPNTIDKREVILNYDEAAAAIDAVKRKERSGVLDDRAGFGSMASDSCTGP
ncbi:MAG TPA: hypothetical protein VHX61_15935 [Rhizomicrobium sp.]|jgi:LPS sulfotransferase NodH|nr:hypothetical protein [Rhizomicrobium sp.]